MRRCREVRMKIESARIMGNDLILTASIPDARRFVYSFKPGEYEISPAKKKRSLNANAYAWKLINDIALAVRESPEDVYREALKNIPNICEVLCVQDKAVDSMERLWTRNHIGRRVEREESKIKGCTNLYIYYGSSDFDTRQMSMLIDNLVQDAQALGIETRPEEEIKSLLEAWE